MVLHLPSFDYGSNKLRKVLQQDPVRNSFCPAVFVGIQALLKPYDAVDVSPSDSL